MKDAGLILEGGGTRGVFTAGVLDYFMEKDLYLPYVIGVSAGACNAVNYVAKQPGRTKACMIDYLNEGNYVGLKYLVKKRSLFDMDLIFDVFPNSEIPFDYDTYFASSMKCLLTVTNCLTGRAEFISEKKDRKKLMDAARASCSLPLISPIVNIGGVPMLDGGMGDSIPIRKALRDGYKKNIIILTRCRGYRKTPTRRANKVSRVVYNNYPNLVRSIYNRPKKYNKTLEFIEKLEEKNRVLVIRPEIKEVSKAENRTEVLYDFYLHGYHLAKKMFPEIKKYLGIES